MTRDNRGNGEMTIGNFYFQSGSVTIGNMFFVCSQEKFLPLFFLKACLVNLVNP